MKEVASKLTYLIALFVLLILPVQASSETDIDWLATNKKVAYKHIVPLYESLANSTGKLASSVHSLCGSSESVVATRKVKTRFRAAYLDWAKVQHIKFGPVGFLKRLERIQFWPDKHNSSERQVRKLLNQIEAGEQYSMLQFQKKSVAVQGFTALERMLFSSDGVMNSQECALANYVAINLREIALELDSNWRLEPVEYAKEFELAGRETGTYGSSEEVITILANAFATQLLIISEYKLGRALPKKEGGRVFARKMEAWRSQQSLEMALASLKSVKSLYELSFKTVLKKTNKELDIRIEKQFLTILSKIKKAPRPMVSLIKDEAGVMTVASLKAEVEKLEAMVRSELFPALGFATRFNSLDGD